MTIATTINKNHYHGNDSTTVFPYEFRILAASHLTVYLTDALGADTLLVLDTDYSVSDVGAASGGNVTYPLAGDPLATGETLTIIRAVPMTQLLDLVNQAATVPQSEEDALDLLTCQTQDINEKFSRVSLSPPTAPPGESAMTQTLSDLRYVRLAGSSLTGGGHISDATTPTDASHLARKGYNDATYVPIAGGVTLAGDLSRAADPSSANHLTRKSYIDDKFHVTTGHDHDSVDAKQIPIDNLHPQSYGEGSIVCVTNTMVRARKPWAMARAATHSTTTNYSDVCEATLIIPKATTAVYVNFAFVFNSAAAATNAMSIRFVDGAENVLREFVDTPIVAVSSGNIDVTIPCCLAYYFVTATTGSLTITAQAKTTSGSPVISDCNLFVQTND